MYGDGCFETLKSYQAKFLGWKAHFTRLVGGLNYLGMELPISSEELKQEVLDLLKVNNLMANEAMVRIQCWREGERGYKSTSHSSSRLIQVSSYDQPQNPIDLITAKTRCIPSEALERKHKLSNGLNYIKAAQEADVSQKDDALMLTMGGFVSETTIANVFWVKDEIFYTPSEECDLLPGITRGIVLGIIQDIGHPLKVGKFKPNSFYEADFAFCTNSLIEIREIGSVDDNQFKTGQDIILDVHASFQAYKSKALTQ